MADKQFVSAHLLTAKEELKYFNIQKEFDALGKILWKNKCVTPYKLAFYKILMYIIRCVQHDPKNGDYIDDVNKKIMREAGILLYESEGMKGMYDTLIWSFIPKRYRREIDHEWDGIGEWLA